MVDPKEDNRNKRRDKQTWNRKYGMRVVGQSVKKLAEMIRRKGESKSS